MVSADVQNWIGTKSVSGFDLGQMLESHLRAQEDIEIIDSDLAVSVTKKNGARPPSPDAASNPPDSLYDSERAGGGQGFEVKTQSGKAFEAKYLLVTSGSRRRKLGVPGEKEFEGKGVAYCSTCDAPVFKDKVVAVVGGGNSGLEAVGDLIPYATKIYLVIRSDIMKGDPITQEKIKKDPKVEIVFNAPTEGILGSGGFVTGLRYKDSKTSEAKELKLDGVFVEIGIVPNSEIVKGLVKINKWGEVVVDHKTQAASVHGIWAAGDVTDVLYKQNNISAGDAVKAVLNIYDHIHERPKRP